MEVSVDRDLCDVNEVCVGIAPAVFGIGENDELEIRRPDVPEGEVERVTQAVASCPKNALRVKR